MSQQSKNRQVATSASNGGAPRHFRIAIIGAGFSGLGMAIRLKQKGIEDFVVFERSQDVGGTWNDNTYPGCQCDVPSHLYSFSFALNPDWSRTYSTQPEIWEYLRGCAQDFGVKPHIRFGHEIRESEWDDAQQLWRLESSQGTFTAQFLVAAPGPLSEPSVPEIPGLEDFRGTTFHSAAWNHEHDLSGERVAVIGTGASAIQFVPKIQPKVGQMHVFQRTPPWVLPHPDRPITRVERWLYRRLPILQRAVRAGVYWGRETLVLGFVHNRRLMRLPQRIALRHMRRQVPDHELRRKLRPHYMLGCKRILPSNDWYPALTRPNVELVTDGIREIREGSILTEDGEVREVDTIVFGTGFHVTDIPSAEHIRGREGRLLSEVWNGSPHAYFGTTIAGFPNLFFLVGPNTGLGHNSIVYMAEAQIRYVLSALRVAEAQDCAAVEVREEAQAAYNDDVQRRMKGTVWTAGGCASWYIDKNGRNSTLWPDFTWRFRQRTRALDPKHYLMRPRLPAPTPEPATAAVGSSAGPEVPGGDLVGH